MNFIEKFKQGWKSFWADFVWFMTDPEVFKALCGSGWLIGTGDQDTNQPKESSE